MYVVQCSKIFDNMKTFCLKTFKKVWNLDYQYLFTQCFDGLACIKELCGLQFSTGLERTLTG